MIKNITIKNNTIGVLCVVILALTACENYNWDPPKYEFDPTADLVSYSDKVAPLFPEYNCTGCHGGVIPPDLRSDFSYQALTSGNYLNMTDAEESVIFIKTEDPEHGGTWSIEDLWIMLDWINQGALNN